jgi:hypothetical protein
VMWKFLEETGWEVGEKMRGERGRMPMVSIAFLQGKLAWLKLSLARGRVCRLQLLLAFASAVIILSESHRTRNDILLSQIRDFPFCPLLRLSGLR